MVSAEPTYNFGREERQSISYSAFDPNARFSNLRSDLVDLISSDRGQNWGNSRLLNYPPINGTAPQAAGNDATVYRRLTSREVPAPTFNGTTNSFLEFLDDFEHVAHYNHWNDDDKLEFHCG